MKQTTSLFCIALLPLLGGCSYSAPINISTSYSLYPNYEDKIPGIYGLYVDAEKMKQDIQSGVCQSPILRYPTDAKNAFTQSVYATFENLVGEIRKVDNLVSATDLRAQGLDGMIKIEVENLEVGIIDTAGDSEWTRALEGDAEITANVQVIGHDGNLLSSTVEASDKHKKDVGVFGSSGALCDGEGGSIVVGKSIEATMKKVIKRLGENLTNSIRVRNAAPKN